MKQIIRYRFMTIPGKLAGDLRITVDDERSPEHLSAFENGKALNIGLYPVINLQITKATGDISESGFIKRSWDINDSIGLTKFTFPIFVSELTQMNNSLKTADLYSYHGDRLELNPTIAEQVRRVFMCSNTTIEFTPQVITLTDGSLVEGIKMKFNNEKSSVLLTLNEITAIIYSLRNLDIDGISLLLYFNRIEKGDARNTYYPEKQVIDIVPKSNVSPQPSVDTEVTAKDEKPFVTPPISEIPKDVIAFE